MEYVYVVETHTLSKGESINHLDLIFKNKDDAIKYMFDSDLIPKFYHYLTEKEIDLKDDEKTMEAIIKNNNPYFLIHFTNPVIDDEKWYKTITKMPVH